MAFSPEQLNHEAKCVLWVVGALTELMKAKLIGGFKIPTDLGLATFDQLHASGFRPNAEEIRQSLRALYKGVKHPDEDVAIKLISRWEEAVKLSAAV